MGNLIGGVGVVGSAGSSLGAALRLGTASEVEAPMPATSAVTKKIRTKREVVFMEISVILNLVFWPDERRSLRLS
jgi:hypothetical protein